MSASSSEVLAVKGAWYLVLPSTFGRLSMVWSETPGRPVVWRLFLPHPTVTAEELVLTHYPDALARSCPEMDALGQQAQAFLSGHAVRFDLRVAALDQCTPFQRRVLEVEHGIPRGWVSTYGRIARELGVPEGARAVGRALATNPFPLIVPCHRAIGANGALGGFQGGLAMKRALLEVEGVEFASSGNVRMLRVHY